MAEIEIIRDGQSQDILPISRRQPLAVGRKDISDICLEGSDVPPMHSRIRWSGKGYEVTAATSEGIEVNGTVVRKKLLDNGDVIRVGSFDLKFTRGIRKATARRLKGKMKPAPKVEEPEVQIDKSGFPVAEVVIAGKFTGPNGSATQKSTPDIGEEGESGFADDFEEDWIDDESDAAPKTEGAPVDAESSSTKPISKRARRPGEEDVLRSPVVLGSVGTVLALFLAAAAIWFVIGRESSTALLDQAQADLDVGRYSQAIRGFEQFLLEYATDSRASEVRLRLGLARVQSVVESTAPDYPKALELLERFHRDNRDRPGFDDVRPEVARLSLAIAEGAAAGAIRDGDRELLETAQVAAATHDRFVDAEARDSAVRKRLTSEITEAEWSARRREFFESQTASIRNQIEEAKFVEAYQALSELLARYPELATRPEIEAIRAEAKAAEAMLVEIKSDDPVTSIGTDEIQLPSTVLSSRLRGQTNEVSDGRTIPVIGSQAVFGIDALTGAVTWRTGLARRPPFAPVEFFRPEPSVLVFAPVAGDLMLLDAGTGKSVWRTPLNGQPVGEPLLLPRRVVLLMDSQELVIVDLRTGDLETRLSFPQPVVGGAALMPSGQEVFVLGESETGYVVTLDPPACEEVVAVGHAPASIEYAPLTMGSLLLLCMNDRVKQSQLVVLRVLDGKIDEKPAATLRLEGRINGRPLLRGNKLFVPTDGERLSAFIVSDNIEQPVLTAGPSVQLPDPQPGPVELVAGSGGRVWMAGSSLRQLTWTADRWEIDPSSIASGRHTQSPQTLGEDLFATRQVPASSAIFVTRADRTTMQPLWRTVISSPVLATSVSDRLLTVVTTAGEIFRMRVDEIGTSAAIDRSQPLPEFDEFGRPLIVSHDAGGNSVILQRGESSRIWIIDSSGRVRSMLQADVSIDVPPVVTRNSVVVAKPGTLTIARLNDRVIPDRVDFQLPVIDGETADWARLMSAPGGQVVAIDTAGVIRVFESPAQSGGSLVEIATAQFTSPILAGFNGDGSNLLVADGRTVLSLAFPELRSRKQAQCTAEVLGTPMSIGSLVVAELADGSVQAVKQNAIETGPLWRVEIGDAGLAGHPFFTEDVIGLAGRDGGVTFVNADDGRLQRRLDLGQPLDGDPIRFDTMTVLTTMDGTLLKLSDESTGTAGEQSPSGDEVD
ncbi:outer membrane protein assembly factor BamB family protein [Stratiformator vulcanicus]|uniref:Outer membrane protein assembly factor BamB n=1 Tax=Stratiformator vulcanicus TaxID=2527980 RepID=A0A517R1Q8_9PLAN|nr:PQQ-binding-like beta-propeller repeat protein [Stratiformator vulcanicus]QDT37773.1 Outer membrane protein assembly factor BamB [Stratiformator vulcanicus]